MSIFFERDGRSADAGTQVTLYAVVVAGARGSLMHGPQYTSLIRRSQAALVIGTNTFPMPRKMRTISTVKMIPARRRRFVSRRITLLRILLRRLLKKTNSPR
jgi:hypothetical protein